MIEKVCQFAERLPQSLKHFFSLAVRLRSLPIDLGKLDLIRLIALGKFVKGKTLQVRSDLLGLTAIEEPWRTVAKIAANLMASTAKESAWEFASF